MRDAQIARITRSRLVALKVASGLSAADAGKWADDHLTDAVAQVQAAPKGTNPFVRLVAWAGNR